MSEIMITKEAAQKVLRPMIVSCGTSGCFEAIKRLESVESTVSLSSVGMDAEGHWLMAAFSRLQDFAVEEKITTLGIFDVARYFGGRRHIEIMTRIGGHAGMGQYLGPALGLVTHILLPLTGGFYKNGEHSVDFTDSFIAFNPDEPGIPCYHLGVVVNIPLTDNQVTEIIAEQSQSKDFMAALKKIKAPVSPPPEYFQALTCTVKKAAS